MAQNNTTIGQRTSDFFAKLVRSWKFVIFQLVFIAIWITLHATHVLNFDPWPFDGLKLILTIEATFMGSMILMNQNRQAGIDRKIIFQDYIIDLAIKKEVEVMLPLVKEDHHRVAEALDILKHRLDKPNN